MKQTPFLRPIRSAAALTPRCGLAAAALLALCWGLLHAPARAQSLRAPESAALQAVAQAFIGPALDSTSTQLRAEVEMGQLDSRLRLAPCAKVEPHLPAGTRLWGRSRIGLRCIDGPTRWNVYLPITVKAWGPAWVLKRPVAAGDILTQEDAELAETDWAAQRASVLANPELWVGRQAAFNLQPGLALRQNMVREVPLFAAGALVRVASGGQGFQVFITGEAMGPGMSGQSTRVRLPGGRVITGVVRDEQTVEVGI